MLSGHLSKVISSLINCTKITENDKNWAKARKEAIGALEAICSSLDIEAIGEIKFYLLFS